MTIAALIFDVDGTLADTEEAHRLAFNLAFAEAGLDWQWSRERYAELRKTTGGKERIAAYVHGLPLGAQRRTALSGRIAALHQRKTAFFMEGLRREPLPLRPGVLRLLREARGAGIALAIAATTTRASIDTLLTTTLGADGPGWFAAIVTGDDVASRKPSPAIYFAVLERLGVDADACIAFEDSGRGVAAARAAGVFTVVTRTHWTRDDNFTGAGLVVSSLGDPGHPLEGDDARRVGGPCVDLAELERRHANRARDLQHAGAAARTGTARVRGASMRALVPGRRRVKAH